MKSSRVKKYGCGSESGSVQMAPNLRNASVREDLRPLRPMATSDLDMAWRSDTGSAARQTGGGSHARRHAKRGIAAEDFIAAQAGERDLQARLPRRPGDESRC